MIPQQVLLGLHAFFVFLSLVGHSGTCHYFLLLIQIEFGSQENGYDEEEGENSTYYLPSVYEGNKSSKSAQKKHKNLKSYAPRCGDAGADLSYVHYTTGSQPSIMFGKRPASLNVGSIPTKRMRTATRHRVVSPFTNIGTVQAQAKADASSGDTNSFHDDQSTLHAGPLIQKSSEVESVADFEKQLSYDCAETFVKTKKKKKAKTLVIIILYLYNLRDNYF